MHKIGKKAEITLSWPELKGKAVAVSTHIPSELNPNGAVTVHVASRLTPEIMGERRALKPLSHESWINEQRLGRLLVTTISLKPSTAILIHEALTRVLMDAEIIEVAKP